MRDDWRICFTWIFFSRWPGFTEHPWRNESATVYAAYWWETFKDNIFSHQLDFEFAIWLFLHDFITYHYLDALSLFEYLACVCTCRWHRNGRTRWGSVCPDGRKTKQCPVNCIRTVSIKWGLSTISKIKDIYCVYTQSTISENDIQSSVCGSEHFRMNPWLFLSSTKYESIFFKNLLHITCHHVFGWMLQFMWTLHIYGIMMCF